MERVKFYLAIFLLLAVMGVGCGWFFGEDSGLEQEVEETDTDYDDMEYDYGLEEDLEDNEDLDEEFDDYNKIYYDDEDFGNDEL